MRGTSRIHTGPAASAFRAASRRGCETQNRRATNRTSLTHKTTLRTRSRGPVTDITGNTAAIWTSNLNTHTTSLTFQLANLQGSIVAQASSSPAATALQSVTAVSEYGVPTTSTPAKYSWLGGKERETELASGIVAMGARAYDPYTGTFLQTDPIPGADANAYGYANGDPVNETDLSGQQGVGHPINPSAFVRSSCARGACTLDPGTAADIGTYFVCGITDGVGCILAGVADAGTNGVEDVADHRGLAAAAVDIVVIGIAGSALRATDRLLAKERANAPAWLKTSKKNLDTILESAVSGLNHASARRRK